MLLLWPANNYWHTIFRTSQPGFVQARYKILTHGSIDPVQTTHAGLEAIAPVEIHPAVHLESSISKSLVNVEGEGIVLLHTKTPREGKGVILLPYQFPDHG